MNASAIKDTIVSAAKIAGSTIKQNSPLIMTVAGCVGVVASVVLACKATTKLEENVNETENELVELHHAKELIGAETVDEDGKTIALYSKSDYSKEVVKVYGRIAVRFIKLYGFAAGAMLISLLCLLFSYQMMDSRLDSALASVAVCQQYIAEHCTEKITEEEIVLDKDGNPKVDKNGEVKTKTVEKEVPVDPAIFSIEVTPETTAKSCTGLSYLDANTMLMFQKEWNRTLPLCRAVTLREVLKDSGFLDIIIRDPKYADLVKASTTAGWIFDPEKRVSENAPMYISFGIKEDFMTNPVLTFNCMPDITKLQTEVCKQYSPAEVKKLGREYGYFPEG